MFAATLALALAADPAPKADPPLKPDKAVNGLLEPIRKEHKLPGLAAVILKGDKVVAAGAVGVRKAGSPEAFTVNDKVHIGSCTKAMTATLIGMLVEEKKLAWGTTLAEVFADRKADIHPDYHTATISQLLSHTAGLPANAPWVLFSGDKPAPELREAVLKGALKEAPKAKPGSAHEYSNLGYVLAGRAAERVTKQSWEELIGERLFKPLRMTSAGFGPPNDGEKVDQPWGHQVRKGEPAPERGDNPPVMGPAGRVHCTLADWAKFTGVHLRAAQGKDGLLKAATARVLHAPVKDDYAGGWLVFDRDWAGGKALMHNGCNSRWYAVVWIAPKKDFAVLVATNCGGDEAKPCDGPEGACDDAVSALIELCEKRFLKK